MEKRSQEEAQHGESQKGEEKRWRKSEERRCSCAKRLANAAGAEVAGQMRDENLHAVVARSTF